MKNLRYNYYNSESQLMKMVNVQSHDQEESKLSSTINTNNGAHTLAHD